MISPTQRNQQNSFGVARSHYYDAIPQRNDLILKKKKMEYVAGETVEFLSNALDPLQIRFACLRFYPLFSHL